jgi:type VI secretion system VgrG family protein
MIRLSLAVQGLDPDRLTPFEAEGVEELSSLYYFDVRCTDSAIGELLGPDLLGRRATLSINVDEQPQRVVHGVIERMEIEAPAIHDSVVYRLRLSPTLCRLKVSQHNQIYGTVAPVSVADALRATMEGELRRESLTDDEDHPTFVYDLRLEYSYPAWPHLVQFQESDFAFVSRLCEHYGVFYFFENTPTAERIVFADCNHFAPMLEEGDELPFTPDPLAASTAGSLRRFEAVCRQVPHKVFLQDYNDELPKLPLLVSAVVDPAGRGNRVEYGAHYRTSAEGEFLARVRAEELLSHKLRFKGVSTAARLAAGRMFTMTDHRFRAWNQQYLVLSVVHRIKATQAGSAKSAFAQGEGEYSNEFVAIAGDIAFRPDLRTPRPRIDGLINGRIESNMTSTDPALDDLGRYRVRLPFDLSTTPDGFGSWWIRKLEPYGGPSNGMHFPLPPGTHVLVAFINGDPDRPVIVGALPAADNPSVVVAAARRLNRITTRSGIVFTMADPLAGDSGGA